MYVLLYYKQSTIYGVPCCLILRNSWSLSCSVKFESQGRSTCNILLVSSSIISLMMVLAQKQIEDEMQCMKANLATSLDRLTMTLEYLKITNSWSETYIMWKMLLAIEL